ncbi:MAG: protein TolR [Burkholderiales bacterium]|uniref:protein TolR n=1 Tax=Inhella sp. TaxID=1921806 RepID=UPI001AD33314|nr:protein TolR [Burkholderiales bacterium]
MPGVAGRGGRRRTINEINMVPFIDVMLVLLIIFMVSAPLITTGVVDLPSVGKAKTQPAHVIHIVVGDDGALKFRKDEQADPAPLQLKDVLRRVREAQGSDATIPVVISADRQVKYEKVVEVMDRLQSGGIQRVGLAVRQGR